MGLPGDADDAALAQALRQASGPAQRRALAKAITLLESTRADHRARADALLDTLLPATGGSLRLGVSGVPGVGKSTFIEALGLRLVDAGHRVAVLAVDPSSSLSGGSILGDKTRMERLSVNDAAFIRPSPAAGNLGGVADRTRECLLLCEAAGFDVVVVETVGVGQSEAAVAGMTDLFVLLQLPNAGDELQALKKGVMELADAVVINKADLDPAAAVRAQAQVAGALRTYAPRGRARDAVHGHGPGGPEDGAIGAAGGRTTDAAGGHSIDAAGGHAIDAAGVGAAGGGAPPAVEVMRVSAATGEGLDALWSALRGRHARDRDSGALAARRRAQDQAWLWERIEAGLRQRFRQHPAVRAALPAACADVQHRRVAPSVAARRLLDLFA